MKTIFVLLVVLCSLSVGAIDPTYPVVIELDGIQYTLESGGWFDATWNENAGAGVLYYSDMFGWDGIGPPIPLRGVWADYYCPPGGYSDGMALTARWPDDFMYGMEQYFLDDVDNNGVAHYMDGMMMFILGFDPSEGVWRLDGVELSAAAGDSIVPSGGTWIDYPSAAAGDSDGSYLYTGYDMASSPPVVFEDPPPEDPPPEDPVYGEEWGVPSSFWDDEMMNEWYLHEDGGGLPVFSLFEAGIDGVTIGWSPVASSWQQTDLQGVVTDYSAMALEGTSVPSDIYPPEDPPPEDPPPEGSYGEDWNIPGSFVDENTGVQWYLHEQEDGTPVYTTSEGEISGATIFWSAVAATWYQSDLDGTVEYASSALDGGTVPSLSDPDGDGVPGEGASTLPDYSLLAREYTVKGIWGEVVQMNQRGRRLEPYVVSIHASTADISENVEQLTDYVTDPDINDMADPSAESMGELLPFSGNVDYTGDASLSDTLPGRIVDGSGAPMAGPDELVGMGGEIDAVRDALVGGEATVFTVPGLTYQGKTFGGFALDLGSWATLTGFVWLRVFFIWMVFLGFALRIRDLLNKLVRLT